jgi:hypothetical protein
MINKYIVVGKDMDGLTGWMVIDRANKDELYSGAYRGSIMLGLSLDKKEMVELADNLNIDDSILEALSRTGE